jgi:hypothetical protein
MRANLNVQGRVIDSLKGKFVKEITTDFNEITLHFNDGSKLTASVAGDTAILEVAISLFVTETFELNG